MSAITLFILLVFAAFYVSFLFIKSEFPPVVYLRNRVFTLIARKHGTAWADGLNCFFCEGFYISVLVTAVVWATAGLPKPAWLWFVAVPGAVGALSEMVF